MERKDSGSEHSSYVLKRPTFLDTEQCYPVPMILALVDYLHCQFH